MSNVANPTQRFSDRVDSYVKYRLTYPQEIIGFITSELGLTRSSVIVDVGSGAGISSELFLKNSNTVVRPVDPQLMGRAQTFQDHPSTHGHTKNRKVKSSPNGRHDSWNFQLFLANRL
ncbi:MAG: hypothetical protein IPJ71_03335 [Bdellovibrionales bacterium]|nr:hypothetical protein [Bdellovibrionales bacterium]